MLPINQCFFQLDSPSISAQFLIAANDPVARDQEGDLILTDSICNGTHGSASANHGGNIGIRSGCAKGNGGKRLPDYFLKRRSLHKQIIGAEPFIDEILLERSRNRFCL